MTDEPDHRPRARANTTSFSAFGWRKPPPPQPSIHMATSSSKPTSIHGLIEDLTPPAVPSLAYARSLAALLQTTSPCPPLPTLVPILGSLCAEHSPASLQAAGYDIFAAYCGNPETTLTSGSDVLACFDLFNAPWTADLWEPRFKAFTNFSNAISFREIFLSKICTTITRWIRSAFDPMLIPGGRPLEETHQRQRGLEGYFAFLFTTLASPQFLSGAHEEEVAQIFSLLGTIAHTAILLPSQVPPFFLPEANPPKVHRKNQSSASAPSVGSSTIRRPADIAVEAYVEFLSIHHKKLSPSILPLLFRSLAFHTTPLPRLSLHQATERLSSIEKKIWGLIDSMFSGSHASSCTLILHRSLLLDTNNNQDPLLSVQLSFGAYRVLRNLLRRSLLTRLARAYISKANSHTYTYTGAAGSVDLPEDFISLAWPKEDVSVWEFSRVAPIFCKSLDDWMVWHPEGNSLDPALSPEAILLEAASLLADVLYALDDRVEEEEEFDEEEVLAVSKALHRLVSHTRAYRTPEGAPYILSRSPHLDAHPTMLQTISFMLSRDTSLPVNWFMPSILLSVADHLSDEDTSEAVDAITKRHGFSPTSPEWKETWGDILKNPNIFSGSRPLTWAAILEAIETTHSVVKDIPSYRKPWMVLVFNFWKVKAHSELGDGAEVLWLILGEEIILRQSESQREISTDPVTEETLDFLAEMAVYDQAHLDIVSRFPSNDSSTSVPSAIPSSTVRPDARLPRKSGEHTLPSVMSILTTFTAGSSSRSQSQNRRVIEEDAFEPAQDTDPSPKQASSETITKSVGATLALILAFSQLALTPNPAKGSDLHQLVRIFRVLLRVACSSTCQKARLMCLRFLMRLRADRDHKVYFTASGYDPDGHISAMARILNRAKLEEERVDPPGGERKERGRPTEPLSHRPRGRAFAVARNHSLSKLSRSPSRATGSVALRQLWQVPEVLPFKIPFSDTPTKGVSSYAQTSSEESGLLPVSEYLNAIIKLLSEERDWEVLSFVLCHVPVQLANKHLFCGPKCRALMGQLLKTLCTGISTRELGAKVHLWPDGLRPSDAHGLAYHSLSVLISYKRCFDGQSLHHLIEVFLDGLSGSPSAIKCCLHALSLSAFELQPSMTRYLSRILEKLSQIMSNPTMSVHIIDFLSIVGSIQSLHVNFREQDYKMVFGVALQYLQQHNRQDSANQISWALSQHVRIMSYYIIYVWFLSLRLSDRPRHIPFICRQLLLANEGRVTVDQSTEVCFDWLARYSYASADPRPANSILNEIVTNPPATVETATSEKTWIVGNSVVTIRTLSRLGWLEVVSRRASGLTKFLCRAENVPLVGPGDLNPDVLSVPASFMVERPRSLGGLIPEEQLTSESDEANISPDPITGYVWSGTAPSQRRKDVAIDPSYFPLQLSSFPSKEGPHFWTLVTNSAKIKSFIRTLDRMPVIDTHKVGIMYVAPGQTTEEEILQNTYGSPAYTRFLEGIGRLINLRGQMDVYAGGLDPDEDGEYAYAWWDDNSQVLYHTATLMPTDPQDKYSNNKKRHVGNDLVRIVWNDSGLPYRFDTLATQFQFVNVVIEPHSVGTIAAFSDNVHENEYFKVTVQRAPGMPEFSPVGEFKLISAQELPLLVRQLGLLSDWFAFVFQTTELDTQRVEVITNWRSRLDTIQRFKAGVGLAESNLGVVDGDGVLEQQHVWDFSSTY